MRLLVVEDDPKMLALLRRGLEEEGLAVDTAGDGNDALWMAAESDYDCVLLDVMLPGMTGVDVCRELRARDVWSPILMLTARDAVADRVEGLNAGADDYLVKPFSFDELLARIGALSRRRPVERPAVIRVGDLLIDPARQHVERCGIAIELTSKEYALLEYLARHAGQVLSRTRIMEHVWDWQFEGLSNVVDVYIGYLRAKVDRPFESPLIRTVRGRGYLLSAG